MYRTVGSRIKPKVHATVGLIPPNILALLIFTEHYLWIMRYLTNRLNFCVYVYFNRSQMTSQNNKVQHETKSSGVTVVAWLQKCREKLPLIMWCDCCSLHAVTSSVIYYSKTHTRKKCNLFVLYNKDSNGLLKRLGGMEKENQIC